MCLAIAPCEFVAFAGQQDALSGMRGRIPDGAEGNPREICGATVLWLLTAYRLCEWVSDSMDHSFSLAYGGIWNAFFWKIGRFGV